jgi:hypothetical protein
MLTYAAVCCVRESDKLFNVFSVTKAVAATAVHLLKARAYRFASTGIHILAGLPVG